MTGRIIRVVADKAYAFICPDDNEQRRDLFCHITSFVDFIRPFDASLVGRLVVYDIETSDKGPRAANVKMLD
jgi:cold shock CspA family protein